MEKKLKKLEEVNPTLEEYLRQNSTKVEDKIIFEEQDSLTLAINITNFLTKNGWKKDE